MHVYWLTVHNRPDALCRLEHLKLMQALACTVAYLYNSMDSMMSSQSFMTPARFMVRAELRPMSMKTLMFSAAQQDEAPKGRLVSWHIQEGLHQHWHDIFG